MQLLTAIANFLLNVPPYAIIEPDEGGVFLRGGKFRRALQEGFYWKWPVYDRIRKIKIREQVIDLKNQSVRTKDGRCVATSGAVKYQIIDVHKAILQVFDYDASLRTLALSVIAEHISQISFEKCKPQDIEEDVKDSLAAAAGAWGIEVLDFWLTDFAQHKVYRIMTDNGRNVIVVEGE